jgi:hypothetical protein
MLQTHIYKKNVILITLPLQQWLQERDSLLRLYVYCLSLLILVWFCEVSINISIVRNLVVCGRIFFKFPNHFSWRNIFGVKIRVCNVHLKKPIKYFPSSPLSTLSLCTLPWWRCSRYSRLRSYRPLETAVLSGTFRLFKRCIRINIGYMFTARKSVLLNSTAWTYHYYYYYYYYYWLDHNNTYSSYYSSYQGRSITEKLQVA